MFTSWGGSIEKMIIVALWAMQDPVPVERDPYYEVQVKTS